MSYEATHRTFVYLNRCAVRHLDIARYSHVRGKPFRQTRKPDIADRADPVAVGEWVLTGGTFFDCMSCLAFCGLTIEAAVNHIAAEVIQHWDHFEGKLKTKEKMALLSEATGCSIDFGASPFNEFAGLQKFRNVLAHGKTETVSMATASSMEEVSADWMKQCTIEKAEKSLAAMQAMVHYMFDKILNEKYPFALMSHGVGDGRDPDLEGQ